MKALFKNSLQILSWIAIVVIFCCGIITYLMFASEYRWVNPAAIMLALAIMLVGARRRR